MVYGLKEWIYGTGSPDLSFISGEVGHWELKKRFMVIRDMLTLMTVI